jgi:hypothetical protein
MLVANTADGSRPGYGGPHDSIGDKNTSSKSGSGAQREGNNNRFEMAYNPPPPSIGTGGEGRDGRFNLTPKEKKDLSKAINLSQRTGSYVPSLGMYKPKNFVRNIFDKSIYGRVLAPFVKMDNNLRKKRKKYLEGKYDVNNPNEMGNIEEDETYMDLTKGINLAGGNMLPQSEFERLMNYQKNNEIGGDGLLPYIPIDYNTGAGTTEDVDVEEDETFEYHLGKGGQKTGRDVTLGYLASGGRARRAHGGIMGTRARKAFGGIMDRVTGRKAYGLGSIFKSVKKAVGKVLKSDIGKMALLNFAPMAFGAKPFIGMGGGQFNIPGGTFLKNKLLMKNLAKKGAEAVYTGAGAGLDWWKVAGLAGVAAPFIEGAPWNKVKPNESLGMAERGGHLIDPITGKEALPNQMRASLENALNTADGDPQKIAAIKAAYPFYGIDERLGSYVPYRNYSVANGGRIGKAEGGLMDLGGMEKDYRAEGGFVPIGAKEKADDVPARLSVNEFVFTADAVRNAGGGDIDQGAEVMENVMKNLEAGGKISAETQGNTGAQEMFSVSERLGEVI